MHARSIFYIRSCMIYMRVHIYHAYIAIYIAIRVFNSVEQVVEKLKIYSRFVDFISDVVYIACMRA